MAKIRKDVTEYLLQTLCPPSRSLRLNQWNNIIKELLYELGPRNPGNLANPYNPWF